MATVPRLDGSDSRAAVWLGISCRCRGQSHHFSNRCCMLLLSADCAVMCCRHFTGLSRLVHLLSEVYKYN